MTNKTAMLTEISQLPADLQRLMPHALEQAREFDAFPREGTLVLTGCGDSLIAARAMSPALRTIAQCEVEVLFPHEIGSTSQPRALSGVIGISASGNTPAVVAALARARACGVQTLILSGKPDSLGAREAGMKMILPLEDKVERVPGIRSYQASLIGLLALATRHQPVWIDRIAELAEAVAQVCASSPQQAEEAAPALAAADPILFLGSGTDLSACEYGVAKRVEASGLQGVARDLEEFWHIERFARSRNPAVLISSGGDMPDALRIARVAKGLGRYLIAVCPQEATGLREEADATLTLPIPPDSLLSPFLSAIPLAALATQEARHLGHAPFQADDPARMETMRNYIASRGTID